MARHGFVVKTGIGDVQEKYLHHVDGLLRDCPELERRLAEVRTELANSAGPKGHNLVEPQPKGTLPGDPTAAAAQHRENLRQKEQELAHQVADAEFLVEMLSADQLALLRRFHSREERRKMLPREKRTCLEILTTCAYTLYGDAILVESNNATA